jgi:hypothetical protein
MTKAKGWYWKADLGEDQDAEDRLESGPLATFADVLAELGMDDIYDDHLSEEENYKKVVVELYDFGPPFIWIWPVGVVPDPTPPIRLH